MSFLDRPTMPQDLQQILTAHRETGSEAAPITLDRKQKILVTLVVVGALFIAGLGFVGSYNAVSALAAAEHFGSFSNKFPIGVDVGIGVFLALDLVLAGLRMPYPVLRPAAWFLTAATILFNASASGDWLGAGMHAVIPLQFIVVIEAGRHAVVRIANLKAHKHIESPPIMRWILSPVPTFRIWRRMRLWQLPSYETVIAIERERRVFRTRLKHRYGQQWRTAVSEVERLALELSRYGVSVADAYALYEADKAMEDTARTSAGAPGQQPADDTRTSVSTSADTPDKASADNTPDSLTDSNVVPMSAPRTTHRPRPKSARTTSVGHDGTTLSGHVRECLSSGITDTDTILKSARDKFGPDTKRETVRRLVSRHTPDGDSDISDRDQLTGTDN